MIFCDSFGSGTTSIAALECGRSIVDTEPDERQWESACARLDAQISNCLRFDDQQARRAAEQQRAEQEEKEAAEKAERASQKTQSLKDKLKTKSKKRKPIADEEEASEGQDVEEEPGVHLVFLCLPLSRRRRPEIILLSLLLNLRDRIALFISFGVLRLSQLASSHLLSHRLGLFSCFLV